MYALKMKYPVLHPLLLKFNLLYKGFYKFEGVKDGYLVWIKLINFGNLCSDP